MPVSRASLRNAAAIAVAVTAGAWLWMYLLPVRSSGQSIDLYFLFYPAHFRFGEEIARGNLPVWNADLGLGLNELADSQFGFLYPPNLLFGVLDTALAIDVLAWLHFALATCAAYLLCQSCGLARTSAAAAAAALTCSAALHVLSGWTTMLATFAWCPVAFLAAHRLGDAPGWSRALALGVVLALQLLAGYLQFSLYTMALLPLFLWPARADSTVTARRLPAIAAWAAVAVALALGLAAPGVLPALAAVPGSLRDAANIPGWFYELIPVRLSDFPLGLSGAALDRRIPAYAGVVVPLLAIGAIVAPAPGDRLRTTALVLTAACAVLSLGRQSLVFPLLWKLPFGHLLTHPHKMVYFFSLGLSLLAASGAQAARTPLAPLQRATWLALGALLLVVVPFGAAPRVAGALLLTVLVFPGQPARRALALALPALIVVATLPGYRARAQRPWDNLNFFVRYDDAYQWLARHGRSGRAFVLTPELTGSPRHGEIVRVAQVTTNGTFLAARLDRYMQEVRAAANGGDAGRASALLRASGARFILTGHDKLGWLDDTGARRVFAGTAADVREDPAALPRAYLARRVLVSPADRVVDTIAASRIADDVGVVLDAEDGAPSVPTTAEAARGEARIVESSDRHVRIVVEAAQPAILVLLDAWSPEWQASVDGRDVVTRRANGIARAIEVPAGRHDVVFRFVPRSLYAGALLSLMTAGVALAVTVVDRRRKTSVPG
ncbi:MAG: YfhO family protein [Deltaproteobacteria bacterium]|nr:YfhO family protein [Deltaproteobacteria bacterium]